LARLGRRLLADESGAEILEYVLIAGLIIAAAITAVATVGTKVLARWTTVSDSSL
jgi:Flp pilus assembly pilin Flp